MRWTWILALVVVLVLAVPTTLFVALGDGGPPPERDGGARSWRPVVEDWRFLSLGGPDAATGSVLCSDKEPCDFDTLSDAAAAGMTCAWEGTVWLSGGGGGTPLVLKDVGGFVAVFVEAGGGERMDEGTLNASHRYAEFPLAWPNGWWWRVESERVHATTPSPCDARVIKLAFNFQSETLLGRDVHLAQTAETTLAPWPSEDADA